MTTPSEPTGPQPHAKQLFWTGALGAVALVLWIAGIITMLLDGPPPPPPGFGPPGGGGPPPGMHPASGWSVVLCQMAIAATALCGLTYLDYRRQGRDMQRDAEHEARAEARHRAMLERVEQIAAQSLKVIEERIDQAKWQGIADALREFAGKDGGEVVPLPARRNGHIRPGQGAS